MKKIKSVTFISTGEKRFPKKGEWYKCSDGNYKEAKYDHSYINSEIFKQEIEYLPEPETMTFKVVVDISKFDNSSLNLIHKVKNRINAYEANSVVSIEELPECYTKEDLLNKVEGEHIIEIKDGEILGANYRDVLKTFIKNL